MPLVHRAVTPVKLSSGKLKVDKYDTEFSAASNQTLANVLRQLASLVHHAGDIFKEVADLTEVTCRRVRSVKLRLDEIEAKSELIDPKLVPVPEGSLDDPKIQFKIRDDVINCKFFEKRNRPKFIVQMYNLAGSHQPFFPPRPPILGKPKPFEQRRPASFAALREWKLDDYLDEKIATLSSKPKSSLEDVTKAVSSSFPSQLVQVDVTGRGFDRMKSNRRSLVIHTKRIRIKKRRNTICGSMPNKECGIQTSLHSVAGSDRHKKNGIDSGHWSSLSSAQGGVDPCSSSAPSPWEDPNSLSTSSDFLFEEDADQLGPQLQNLTDGLISDSDSVDTEGYFTSFRNECGFPKSKVKSKSEDKEEKGTSTTNIMNAADNEYELFGKGSTSTNASSCGTVIMRSKPEPPARNSSENVANEKKGKDDGDWDSERVKRKSLIERVPSLVVVTPSPSCSSASPPPLKDPVHVLEINEDSSDDRGGIQTNGSEDDETTDTDSAAEILGEMENPGSTESIDSDNSTLTLTEGKETTKPNLPQPDVIPDVQIRTPCSTKLDFKREYLALDTVPRGSSKDEELRGSQSDNNSENESKKSSSSATSGRIKGARVVLDANGEIIFSSETLRRKRRHKVSFDPGNAVKVQDYDSNSTYARIRESVYDRIKKEGGDKRDKEKLYETIEEIRKQNMKPSERYIEQLAMDRKNRVISPPLMSPDRIRDNNKSPCSLGGESSDGGSTRSLSNSHPKVNVLLETDLDSAIPPEMPELKNLPKIKDRLKRNESYRIATDEVPPMVGKKNSQNLANKKAARDQARKRDIPEEDPVFIQQILSLRNKSPINSNSNRRNASSPTNNSKSPLEAAKLKLSKFAWSPEDRPSFLRKESSTPTMDEIAKEIYRFRKKFNINPSPPSASIKSSAESSLKAIKAFPTNYFRANSKEQFLSNGVHHSSNKNANPPPNPPPRNFPPSYKNPPKPIHGYNYSVNGNASHLQVQPIKTTNDIQSRAPLLNGICGSTPKRGFFGNKIFPMSNSFSGGLHSNGNGNGLMRRGWGNPGMRNSVSETAHLKDKMQNGEIIPSNPTSLGDFKRLLQVTNQRSSMKRNSISAVEILLKPKYSPEQETTL